MITLCLAANVHFGASVENVVSSPSSNVANVDAVGSIVQLTGRPAKGGGRRDTEYQEQRVAGSACVRKAQAEVLGVSGHLMPY